MVATLLVLDENVVLKMPECNCKSHLNIQIGKLIGLM